MNKDILFSQWYDSLEGTKSQGFAYKAWCAGWDAARLEEREACAKLCDDINRKFAVPFEVVSYCAKAIRGRTE
jgi:hypothetical protein